jgi:formate hydrogenlyase transcriptional activator
MHLVRNSSLESDARYRALVEVASALTAHADLADVLLSLRRHLEPLIEFTFLVVSLWDSERDTITLTFFEPYDHEASRLVGSTYPSDGTYPGMVVHRGQPVYVSPVLPDGPYPSRVLAEYGVQSYCAVPLVTARGPLGSLNFGSLARDAYSPDDVEFMGRVANLVAVAVENARSLEIVREQQRALRRERDQLGLLIEVTNAVVTQLDTRALFAAVAPALRRCCGADLAALTLYDAETQTLRKHACDAPTDLPIPPPPAADLPLSSPSGLVFTSGQPRVFSLPELMAHPDTELLVARGVRSACSVPLATAQGILGTLDLAAFARDAFSPEQFGLITRIAGQIAIALRNAFSYQRIEELNAQLAQEKLYLEDEIRSDHLVEFEDIIGRSTALGRVLREIETVAPTDSTVLITGETGSGKELVARAIHKLSARRQQAFVKLNCAAIPTGLLESELFGHEKGAFTGAIAQRIGRFELANRGTVFLDEVGEIPLELQPKLLRVLQEREFERLGSARTLRTDARLIAATNRDLAAMVDEHAFRQDLFYRLNVFPIHVPALRDRREDIPMLVRHFAQQFARRMKKTIETIPAESMSSLVEYDWPGNIRELQNLIERAVILSPGPALLVPFTAPGGRAHAPARAEKSETLQESERRHILAALDSSKWVIAGPNGAAARLGMKRSTLQFRMRKLGIARPPR